MRHAIIIAHPRGDESFTAAMAKAYGQAARALGHTVVVRDLYGMDFDPRLRAEEIPYGQTGVPAEDVVTEREILSEVDVIALFYPLWFNAPPAILKGYVDRVFSLGVGRRPTGEGPALAGKKLISFSVSGAPEHWVRDTGAMKALTTLFDDHVAGVCGLTVTGHTHFGGVTPGIRPDAVKDMLETVKRTVGERFGGGPT